MLELLKESVIVQAVLAVAVVATGCFLAVTGQEVPDWLLALLFAIIGFYFGSKVEYLSRRGG